MALILASWLAQRITRPVRELTQGAEKVAAGAYGHKVWAESADEVGQLARTFNHMSERLAAQFLQLDEDRQQLRTVLSSMVEGVVAIDPEQRVLFANERAGRLLDFAPDQAMGRRLYELVRHHALQELIGAMSGQSDWQHGELSLNSRGARNLAVHVGRLPGAPPRGMVLVFHDVSELRRLERLRREFVANVSHELKTPLAVIKASVETLLDGAVEDRHHCGQFLHKISDQAERLHRLILDLLSLARIESETEAFTFQEVDLGEIVQDCLERNRPLAEGKKQTLQALAPPAELGPVLAWADEEAVRQILGNLVDNALKYTPEGGTVRVRWDRQADKTRLEVEDTGIGIPEAELPRIFERFYRVDKARSRALGGTGLGLSIVKHLAQAMRGTVEAESKPNQGSIFRVLLPVSSPP